jgi:hypothetical protein
VIKPTVGRVVWFWDSARTAEHPDGEPLAAIIARVWSDTCVNLCVLDSNGTPTVRTSATLYQGEGERPGGAHAEWMPYQLGQAAKTQQLEQHVAMEAAAQAATPYQGYEMLEVSPSEVLQPAEFSYSEGPVEIDDNTQAQEPTPL